VKGGVEATTIVLFGATGVIGSRLAPLLVGAGHRVIGVTRSPGKIDLLRGLGCEPAVCDVFDAAAVGRLLEGAGATMIIDQLTDLPDDPADIPRSGGANARIRREGTPFILAAAAANGIGRYLAQSVAWELAGEGGAAVAERERMVLGVGGVVIRYGQFYGPGTYQPDGPHGAPAIHIDDAARRTMDVLDAPSGVVTIAD
jgi:uncharacterized protein YbjT (DUF2867 family)